MRNNEVFVKFNFKSITESKTLIIDKDNVVENKGEKYLMCAGKHDRNGWTVVFKARNYKEAEYIIENNPFKNNTGYTYSKMYSRNEKLVC